MTEKTKRSLFSRPLISGAEGFTLRALIFSYVVAFINTYLNATFNFTLAMGYGIPLIVWLAFDFLAMRSSGKTIGLTPQEWTVWLIGQGFGTGWHNQLSVWLNGPTLVHLKFPEYVQYLPRIWTVFDEKVIEDFTYGGAVVPWGYWITPLLFWALWAWCIFLSTMAISLPMRKIYTEVERLPVPNIVSNYELVKRAKEQDRPSLFSWKQSKWLWIGAIIGAMIWIPNFLAFLLPVPPHLFFGWIPINLTPYLGELLPGAELTPALVTGMFPVAMFTPIDVAATALLVWVVLGMLVPGIGIKAGLFPLSPNLAKTFKDLMFMDFSYNFGGVIWGFGIWVLWHYRDRWIHTLKAFIKGGPAEEGEPISWRLNWTIYIAATLILLGLCLASGIPIAAAFFLIFVWQWMNGLYAFRLMYESGFWVVSDNYGGQAYVRDFGASLGLWPEVGVTGEKFRTMAMWGVYASQGGHWSTLVDVGYAPYGWKLGQMTGTPTKSVFLGLILTSIIGVFVGAFTHLTLTYAMGYNTIASKWWVFGYNTNPVNCVDWFINTPTNEIYNLNMYIPVAIGAIITVFCFWARTVWPAFFLNPVGFAMGTIWWLLPIFVVAFIIKLLVIKFGGPQAYENYLVPIAVGYGVGGSLANFIITGIQFATL